jgi:hypothetical protein
MLPDNKSENTMPQTPTVNHKTPVKIETSAELEMPAEEVKPAKRE